MNTNQRGFLSYSKSNNLGDYIQSIAAKHLIGKKFINVDREKLNTYPGPSLNLIMNGWFMENPKNWPPTKNIKPLIISFHLNPTAEKKMLSVSGVEYFKKHEPIGCRDTYTQKILSKRGIKAYFSGCLTLTLQNKNKGYKKDGILIVSALERMNPKISMNNFFIQLAKFPKKYYNYKKSKRKLEAFISDQKPLKAITKSQIVDITQHTEQEKFLLAQKQLDMISKSKLVITSRIHTALPAIALGTKVIFLTDGLDHINQKSRLEGLSDYFYCCKTSDLSNLKLNEILPKKNHEEISKDLSEKVNQFFIQDK
tara:strand:- start:2130 stop:3062 length:933 start_codon:yes stop_codon:yes gene_type:complete